jgi:hypothetical protein
MSGKKIVWELLKELECPVCSEYMASPIKMCENGHNICSGCKERLSECPSCRGKFINARNISLEKFAAIAIYPCKNREVGCEETFTADNRESHMAVCLFRGRECPFRKLSGVDCPWTGTLSDIAVHIKGKHARDCSMVPGNLLIVLYSLARGMSYSRAIFTLGKLFYLTCKVEGDFFSFGVFHIGPEVETQAFKFSIKMGGSKEYISVTRKCHSYLEGELKDLHPGKYVSIYYDTILDFVGESGNLTFEIEIRRETLDGFSSEKPRIYPCFIGVCDSASDL